MYFKISNSKGNKYLQLVESYRNEQGKPRQRLVANLCNVSNRSDEEILKLCESFLRALGVEKIAFLEDLTPEESYDYGDVLPVIALWEKLKLEPIIQQCLSDRVQIDVAKATLIMVANKFVDPQSKLGAWLWYDRSVFSFAQEFQHLPAKSKGLLQSLYRSLDYLTDCKIDIEKELYYQLQCYGMDTELVLYDITSSYFEGDEAELAEYGYSRDHRRDRPQIVIGVVTSKEGIPFAHYVFKGNTPDKNTVREVLADIKERFGITHCIFVGDRGMVSRINLDTIKGHEYDYIMGIRRHNSRIVRQLLPFIQKNPKQKVLEIKPEQLVDEKLKQEFSPQTRFVIGFNEAVRDQVRQNRANKFNDFEAFVCELAVEDVLEKVSDSKTKIISYLKSKKIKRFFDVSIEETDTSGHYRLVVAPKPKIIEQEQLIDGHFFIQTEVNAQEFDGDEVVMAYKSLQKVERIFRVLKNNIELRPIYVRKEKRIRGHVFICFLTYLIECLLERTLSECLPGWSLEHMKRELARIKLIPVKLSNRILRNERKLYFVSGGGSEIQKFYRALKIVNFRHPQKLHFTKDKCTGNFSNQLSLFPIFSMN
jgi:transposase